VGKRERERDREKEREGERERPHPFLSVSVGRKYLTHGAGVGEKWDCYAFLLLNCSRGQSRTIRNKILHGRQKSGHVFNHLGGKNSYRFWLGEADGSELREQGTAAVAAAAATATAQLFPSDRRASGQPEMSWACVCSSGVSGELLFFPFICVALLQGLK